MSGTTRTKLNLWPHSTGYKVDSCTSLLTAPATPTHGRHSHSGRCLHARCLPARCLSAMTRLLALLLLAHTHIWSYAQAPWRQGATVAAKLHYYFTPHCRLRCNNSCVNLDPRNHSFCLELGPSRDRSCRTWPDAQPYICDACLRDACLPCSSQRTRSHVVLAQVCQCAESAPPDPTTLRPCDPTRVPCA